jgi:hypothetical protein
VTLENKGTADTSDFSVLELWHDTNYDSLWQIGDEFIGEFNYSGGTWHIDLSGIHIGDADQILMVTGDVSDSTKPNATFKGQIPINGCHYISGNDGPIDSVLSMNNPITISSSGLAIWITPVEKNYSVEQNFTVNARVTSLHEITIDDVFCELIGNYDSGTVVLDSSYSGPVSITPLAFHDFKFYFTATAPGQTDIQLHSIAPNLPDTSAAVSTGDISIQTPPAQFNCQLINSMPSSVIKGQSNVFPMSLRYQHPDSMSNTAAIRIDSLCLTIENGSGQSLSASDVFSHISMAAGYSTVAAMENIPTSSTIWLTLQDPAIIQPGNELRFSFLVDIDSASSAADFVVSISDASSIPVVDNNSLAPIAANPSMSFPLKTAICRIDDPSEYLFVSSESVSEVTANYGQENVPVLLIDTRHPGSSGNSQIQLTSLEVQCLDATDSPVELFDIFDAISLVRNNIIIGFEDNFNPDEVEVAIDLNSPVTLNPGESEQITVEVDIKSNALQSGFKMAIADSTAFTVRDLSSGSILPSTTDTLVLATGISAFPMLSDWVALKQPASAPEVCIYSDMPPSILGGADSLEIFLLSFSYPVSTGLSPVRINDAKVAVLDSMGIPLDPYQLFDRVGYAFSGGQVVYQPYFSLIGGQVFFSFGENGQVLNPGEELEIRLLADIRPDTPFDHFRLLLYNNESLSIVDNSDTSHIPGMVSGYNCTLDFPYETSVIDIFLPAGRPLLNVSMIPVQSAYPGRQRINIWSATLSYPTSIPQGDILLNSLHGKVYQRTPSGLIEYEPGILIDAINLVIDQIPQAGNQIMDTTGVLLAISQDLPLSRNERFEMNLACDLNSAAKPGNYIIEFSDSTFLGMSDRDLGSKVYAILQNTDYPLYSAEISITEANLRKSFRNYPNPFNPSRGEYTTIAYVLSAAAYVDIEMFTITGDAVKVIADNAYREAGSHQVDIWDGRNGSLQTVVSGTYYCRIIARYTSGEIEELKRKIALIR